jgi:hypothetical protein
MKIAAFRAMRRAGLDHLPTAGGHPREVPRQAAGLQLFAFLQLEATPG